MTQGASLNPRQSSFCHLRMKLRGYLGEDSALNGEVTSKDIHSINFPLWVYLPLWPHPMLLPEQSFRAQWRGSSNTVPTQMPFWTDSTNSSIWSRKTGSLSESLEHLFCPEAIERDTLQTRMKNKKGPFLPQGQPFCKQVWFWSLTEPLEGYCQRPCETVA